jgi:tetratricopeptide (TPR) repeat protein
MTLLLAGSYRLSRDEAKRSVEALETDEAENTVELAQALRVLANASSVLGDVEEARRSRERALDLDTRTLGAGAVNPGHLLGVAVGLEDEGNYAEAIPVVERTLSLLGDVPAARRNGAHLLLAHALLTVGRFEAAPTELDAVEIPADDGAWLLARVQTERGLAARLQRRYDVAVHEYRTAATAFERVLGPDHPENAAALVGLGRTHLERGRADLALPLLERAIHVLGDEAGANDLAETRLALAQGLVMTGKDARRARDLARKANAAYARTPLRAADTREITGWLAQNAPSVLAPE